MDIVLLLPGANVSEDHGHMCSKSFFRESKTWSWTDGHCLSLPRKQSFFRPASGGVTKSNQNNEKLLSGIDLHIALLSGDK